MRVLVLVLCLVALASANQAPSKVKGPVARWGIPSFEDEACVLCQYVVQRVENRVVQHLDQMDRTGVANNVPSTADPFAPLVAPQPAVPGTASSAADAMGMTAGMAAPVPSANQDLAFEPSINYKKQLIRSLRSRWGGASILRKIWEGFLTDFCAQDKLPEMYVPVCSMMYEQARKIMKLIYYGFPNDQVCLMSKMCGKNSYFTTPTAVHDPVMSLYWNNKRGLDGFEGGVAGVTKKELMELHSKKKKPAKKKAGKKKPVNKKAPKAPKKNNKKKNKKKGGIKGMLKNAAKKALKKVANKALNKMKKFLNRKGKKGKLPKLKKLKKAKKAKKMKKAKKVKKMKKAKKVKKMKKAKKTKAKKGKGGNKGKGGKKFKNKKF